MPRIPSLGAALITRKGEAAPSIETMEPLQAKPPSPNQKPLKASVKLDHALNRRLKTMIADTRRPGQDIMTTALSEYLERNGY